MLRTVRTPSSALVTLLALSLLAFSAACSGDDTIDPAGGGDAATARPDAASSSDAGIAPDSGGSQDASALADTGATPDVGLTDGGATPDTGAPVDAGPSGAQPFGGSCTSDQECEVGFLCRTFNQLGDVCTKACASDGECPAGSMGQRCNNMGYCRP